MQSYVESRGRRQKGELPSGTGGFLVVHEYLITIAIVSILAVRRDLRSFNDQQSLRG